MFQLIDKSVITILCIERLLNSLDLWDNRCADTSAHPSSLISAVVVRFLDRIIGLFANLKKIEKNP